MTVCSRRRPHARPEPCASRRARVARPRCARARAAPHRGARDACARRLPAVRPRAAHPKHSSRARRPPARACASAPRRATLVLERTRSASRCMFRLDCAAGIVLCALRNASSAHGLCDQHAVLRRRSDVTSLRSMWSHVVGARTSLAPRPAWWRTCPPPSARPWRARRRHRGPHPMQARRQRRAFNPGAMSHFDSSKWHEVRHLLAKLAATDC